MEGWLPYYGRVVIKAQHQQGRLIVAVAQTPLWESSRAVQHGKSRCALPDHFWRRHEIRCHFDCHSQRGCQRVQAADTLTDGPIKISAPNAKDEPLQFSQAKLSIAGLQDRHYLARVVEWPLTDVEGLVRPTTPDGSIREQASASVDNCLCPAVTGNGTRSETEKSRCWRFLRLSHDTALRLHQSRRAVPASVTGTTGTGP